MADVRPDTVLREVREHAWDGVRIGEEDARPERRHGAAGGEPQPARREPHAAGRADRSCGIDFQTASPVAERYG